ncbi:hypothetical protein [Fimbriiglobus ruber]|uniref:Uncharacterized protein n=1 Tax=Fimbriiglobus ruber TaxID=1908690 RepID=A0A225DMC5_9BACT|nr:hypothetical protein [Fimbriiglobus ruber]OWK42163.1 hypothetical protein FRUB_04241 [Fimbriiglobus ruber]
MTRYFPDTHDAILRHLFQCRMSDEQIAERMGLGWQTIRRNRERLGLGMPNKRETHSNRPEEPLPRITPEPTNPILIARQTLGKRVTESNGCYLLDRTPTSAPDLVREANRVRLKLGREQFGPEAWRV